jgi:Lar family restriction alleviation protein
MSELQPCPFCGGKARIVENIQRKKNYYAVCDNVMCAAQTGVKMMRERAIDIWNNRKNPAYEKLLEFVKKLSEEENQEYPFHAITENDVVFPSDILKEIGEL